MDARTLEALKASIAKWERNAVAEMPREANVFADSCPLCALFNYPDDDDDESKECIGCPVMMRTGRKECGGSPWDRACGALQGWKKGVADAEEFHSAARVEVSFLKSLLPSDEAAS